MRWIIFILIISGSVMLRGQDSFTIDGQVTSGETGHPVSNVHIKVSGSFFGTYTNEDGYFELTLDRPFPSLTFSHVAFEPDIYEINDTTDHTIHISMEPKITELGPVSISGDGVEKIIDNDSITIVDYQVIHHRLLLMKYNYVEQSYYLQLHSLAGQPLSRTYLPGRKPYRLYRDCLGNDHLLARDTSYQIFISGENISFLYPENRYHFLKVMDVCAAARGNTVYLRSFDDQQHVVWYGFVMKGEKEATDLQLIVDMETLEKLRDYREFLAFKSAIGMSSFDYEGYVAFGDLIFNKPVYAPLFSLNNAIYVFNHPAKQIEKYEWQATRYDSVTINYQDNPNWNRQVLMDPVEQKSYAVFEKRGYYHLKPIDLQTGEAGASTYLKYRFPEKIKLYGGMVYFLYNKDGRKEKFIYRQVIQ